MKAVTVRQPWAWCIAAGHKDVENRGWSTSYRGPLAIHAGKAWDVDNVRVVHEILVDLGVVNKGEQVGERHLLATGAVVAVVELVGVCAGHPCRCSTWAAIGQKHWRFADVRALLEPVPARGQQGLWDVDLPAVTP